MSSSHPFWPGLGALLLKVRAVLCLNLGGAFLSAGAGASAIVYDLREKELTVNHLILVFKTIRRPPPKPPLL